MKSEGIYNSQSTIHTRCTKITHLRRIGKHGIQTQVPVRVILNLRQSGRNSNSHVLCSTRDTVDNLGLGIVAQIAQVAVGVVVQPDAVVAGGVLVEDGVAAVAVPVEGDLDGGAGGQGGVLGDALVDVDAGVVALAPGYCILC